MFNFKKMLCKYTFLFSASLVACVLASCGDDSASTSTNADAKVTENPVLNCAEIYGMPDNVEWTSDVSENIYARQEILKAVVDVISPNYKKVLLYYDADYSGYRAEITEADRYRSFDNRYEKTFMYSIATSFYSCYISNFKDSRGYPINSFIKLNSCLCKYGENGEILFSKSASPINMELEKDDVVIVDTNLCKNQYNAMMQKESESYKGVYGEYIDIRDNRVYKTIEIGKQTWLAENIRYQGSPDDILGFNDTVPKFDYDLGQYVFLEDTVHGRFYDFADWEKICPAGYHLPSQKDWYELIKFVMDDQQLECDYAFAYLKKPDDWMHNKENPGFDIYGFSALAEGGFDITCGPKGIYNRGSQTYYAAKDAFCSIFISDLKFNCKTTADSSYMGSLVVKSVAPIRCLKD